MFNGTVPRVSTPSVVDFPLSTLPTTAQRTSGVLDTECGSKRRSSVSRERTPRASCNTEACTCVNWWICYPKGKRTLPPISSTVSIIAVRNLSISSCVLDTPDQPSQSSANSSENSFVCGGCCPILKMYSPCRCVSKEDSKSFAMSRSASLQDNNEVYYVQESGKRLYAIMKVQLPESSPRTRADHMPR